MGAINFANWRLEERDATLSAKKNTTLIVDRATLGFEKIDQALKGRDLSIPFEVPPAVANKEQLAEVIRGSLDDDPKSRWLRTVARVYATGGRILYRRLDADNFEASIVFYA